MFTSSRLMKSSFAFYLICKLEKHLHTLPPSAAPHWLTGWKAAIPLAAWGSSPLTACAPTLPTFSLFHPPCVAFDSIPLQCSSWTAEPPTGCSCSAPPATGCAPCPAPPLLLSDWSGEGQTGQEQEKAQRSRTCAEQEGLRSELLTEFQHDATMGDVKTVRSENGSFPCHCCCRVI